jgi:hypothetical protein
MRTLHAAGFAAVLAATALVAPGGASAATPTTVSGEFSPDIAYEQPCTGDIPSGVADGTWSVTLNSRSTAKGTFVITVGGEPHVAYTFPGMKQAPNSTVDDFMVYGKTMAGLLTVRVADDLMSYRIEPYSYDGLSCKSVTYFGTVD